MKNLLNLGFTSTNGVVTEENGAQKFSAKRAPIGEKFLMDNPLYTFTMGGPIELEEYVVIEYDGFGIKRTPNVYKGPFMTLKKGDENITLFRFDDMLCDKKSHTIIVRAPEGSFESLSMSFRIDKLPEAYFNITKLYSCKKDELPLCCEKGMTAETKAFTPIDISDKFDMEYDFSEFDSLNDAGRYFDKESVSLYGVPFSVKTSGKNLVAAPPAPAENDEEIVNFGKKCKKRICRAVSRDGETVVNIGKKASEIYFILTLSGKRHIRLFYGSDPTILGQESCDLSIPFTVEDVEYFMAEVVYKDGRRDTHLPLNLSTGRHGIQGDVSVYAVPCDGEVESLIIHNRNLDTDVNLAAVTVNETDERLYPDMLIPEMDEKIVREIPTEKGFSTEGKVLTIKNGAISMVIDLSNGLYLLDMKNAYTPDMKIGKGSLLKTRAQKGEINEEFEFQNVQYFDNYAKITYKYDGAIFDITADISEKDSVKWLLEIVNMADGEFKAGIMFPCLPTIDFGSFADNWYYLPKYQNLNSNETMFMYEESAPSFPLQFMDIYSPKAQGGICVSTQERELITRKYALNKDEKGLELYVEYPYMYGDIESRGTFKASPALITVHDGDWRKSFKIYKGWLDSWYTPYKCQNKQWYRESFWLLAEITDFFESEDMCAWPCWYNQETKEFNFRKILEEQKGITGVYPDILHMWSWCCTWRDGQYGQRWGNYDKEDYDFYGGLEAFRNALHDIRDNMGVHISLYMHPTLLSNSYEKFNKFKDTSMVKSEHGGPISICGDSFRMCHAEEKFREASLSMYPRLYEETKIPLIYVDEFSLRIGNRCYEENHGHHIPSNLLQTDREYISRLKDIMPEEVVLYGEYAAADVNARYIDCNISYYILDSIVDMIETTKRANDGDDRLSRVFMHAYRFAFPGIVQLILPMAMRNISWHPQKFLFFNAEAIYDSFWDCEESRGQDFTVHAYKLKKAYQDCFTSDNPEMLIETESPAICMNKFPANDGSRTVYTVYNRAYSTFRGVALKVPHVEGTKYYDAWNEKELSYKVVDGMAEIYLEIGAQDMSLLLLC